MKKTITKLMAALALLLFVAPPLVGWGQTRTEEVTYTLDGTQTGGSNAYATESEITQGNITWMVMGNTTMNPWRIGGKNLSEVDRPLYSTSTLSDDIAKVVVTNGTATATVNSMTLIVSANSDFSNPTSTVSGTWAASSTTTFERPANTDWSNMYFKLVYNVTAGSSNQYAQFVKAEFYKLGDTSIPSIEAENVELDYDATEGAIEYYINNGVEGGELSAEVTEGEWLENLQVGETVTFNCDPNQAAASRTATVTLTYTYGDSQTVTKNVTVTQAGNPDVINNIEDITATGAYTVQGTIVAMSTRGFVLGDGTGYVYYYYGANFSSNYTIGDKVKLAGDVSVYGGVYQYTSSATITAVETSNYEAEDPTILSGSDMDARVASTTPPQLSTYVQYVGTLTISGTYYNITGIDGATTAKGSISYPTNTDFTSLNGEVVTVTGYYVGVSSNQYYNTMIGSIEEVVSMDPSIEANDVEITYDTDADEIEYTINNPVEGGILTAATQSDWLTLGVVGGTIPFTCSINESAGARTATVTLTYTYGDNQTVTKDVTVTQEGDPNIVDFISDITEVGTSYKVRGTVVAINSRGFIMGDGTGYVYYYKNAAPTQSIGDMVTVLGTIGEHSHVFQFTNSATVEEASSSNYNNTPAVQVITEIPDYTNGNHLSTYLQFEGALTKTNGNYFISLGEAQIQVSYPTSEQGNALTVLDGKQVLVKGYFAAYNTNEYFTVMLESVEEIVSAEPSITVTPDVVNVDADEHDGTLELAYENLTITSMEDFDIQYYDAAEGQELNGDDVPAWIEVLVAEQDSQIGEGYVVSYIIDANEGEARTAYFKVFAINGEEFVYSNLVTVNQEAGTAPVVTEGWVLTELADLTENDIFVIVGNNGSNYAMSNSNGTGAAPAAIAVTVANGALTGVVPDSIQWNMTGNANDGYTFYPNSSTSTWLYCTNTNNGVRVGVNATNNIFVIDNGYLKNVATSRYVGIYNSSDWRCYQSINNNIKDQTFAFYRYTGPFLKVTPNQLTVNYMGSGEGDFAVTPMNVSNAFGSFVRFYDPANPENELDEEPSWIFLSYGYEETITLSYTIMETNNSYTPRTACFKYYVMCDNGGAWSNLITVTQNGKPYPTISITDDVIDVDAEGGYGTLTVDYQNFIDIVADVYFCDANGEAATYDWITADINNDNNFNLEYQVEENTGEARSAYFKVYAMDDETNLVYSNLVTVNQGAYVAPALYTYSINGNEGETFEVEAGATIILKEGTDLNEDFTFAGWTTDPNDVSQRLTGEYTLTEDVTVFYAIYERKGTVSIIDAHTENFPTSYGTANTFTEYTLNGKQFMIQQAYINGGKLQFRASGNNNGTGTLYNSESLGTISSIVLNYNSSDTKKNFSINAGTSANPTEGTLIEPTINGNEYTFDLSGGNYSYFVLTNGVNAGYLDNIIINATNSTSEYYTRVFFNESAQANINIIGPSIVPSGYLLDMVGSTINNVNPANLLIEGEVVCYYNFNGTMQRNIAACDYNENDNAGYNLIASPIDNFVPSNDNGFITDQYDLYAYNAAHELEWINYKDASNNFTSFQNNKGYLYANGANTTLKFAGLLNGFYTDTVGLAYAEGDNDMKRLTLIGNPLTRTVYYYVSKGNNSYITSYFLTLNTEGNGFITDGPSSRIEVKPMEAFFVLASEDGQSIVIEDFSGNSTPGGGGNVGGGPGIPGGPDDGFITPNSHLNITVSGTVSGQRGIALLDNAIVSFGEGTTMKKLYLSENSTRVYIPQSNKDYAVVRSAAQGEMPVNFKASKNGSYTLAIDAENVEMNYLHLIDNMTGADIDLLATPSYTFDAKTTDYASRFKLVFSANANENDDENETFAFFNGSVWCISNTGEATLQVVDMLGRIVSSESVNGNATISTDNLMSGVYMFRLVNGENVKVQKVVVK